MTTRISVNGKIGDETASISVLDRGFLYGDSVYEVLRTYSRRLWALPQHLERLERSAALLQIELPRSRDQLVAELERALAAAANRESYVRVIVTRGVGPITLDPATAAGANCVVIVTELPPISPRLVREGSTVHLVRRPGLASMSASALAGGAKSGNYLLNIMAVAEARRRGADEALIVDADGRVTEGASSNVFVAKRGKLCTPPVDGGILAGITRRVVLELCSELGLEVEQCELTPEDLVAADEICLTSTLREVVAVTRVDDTRIGDGRPGPLVTRLRQAFERRVRGFAGGAAD